MRLAELIRDIWHLNTSVCLLRCSYAAVLGPAALALFYRVFEARRFASRTRKIHTSRPVRLRPTARRRDKPRRPHRLGPRTLRGGALPVPQYGAARARRQAHAELRARINGRQRACVVPRPRTRRDSAGQPPPAGSASRRPTTSRSGTARHHRSDRRPNRGSPSTSRTNLRHRRAPHKRTRQKHRRRSRAFPASILWPPMNQTCTTGPSAQL